MNNERGVDGNLLQGEINQDPEFSEADIEWLCLELLKAWKTEALS